MCCAIRTYSDLIRKLRQRACGIPLFIEGSISRGMHNSYVSLKTLRPMRNANIHYEVALHIQSKRI